MDKIVLSETGKKYAAAAGICLFVFLAMKYISPILSPFLFAFLLAGFLNPSVQKLHTKFKIKKSISAGIILIFFGILTAALIWFAFSGLLSKGGELAGHMPEYQKDLCILLKSCCGTLEKKLGVDGIVIENFVLEQVNVMIEKLEVNVLPAIMGKSMDCVKTLGGCAALLAITAIAVLLLTKDYDKLSGLLNERPEFRGVIEVGRKVFLYIKIFIKAQFIILCVIGTLCASTLGFIGIEGGILLGILTGLLDMLPFIGTGLVLFPLAFFCILEGSYTQAALCVALYGICALTREFLEPKLIGDRIGVWPAAILFSVFAGIKLFGLGGIVKGPLSLVIICESCKYLWDRQNEQKKIQ